MATMSSKGIEIGTETKSGKNKKLFIIVFVLLALLGAGVFVYQNFFGGNIKIVLRAEMLSIIEGEEMPQLVVNATSKSERSRRITPFEEITVGDILDQLNNNEGYEVFCEPSELLEGEYPIEIAAGHTLKQELRGKLIIEHGILTVKNRYGEWAGEQFKRHDGSYVQEDFVVWQGDKYYFDAQGDKVVGELKLSYTVYTFDEEGKVISEVQLIDPTKPMVALTYDDGPAGRTGELLDILEENKAHATFFLIGQNINDENAHLLKRMIDIGSEIGNHSWSHPDLSTLEEEMIKQQVEDTNGRVLAVTGVSAPMIMRLPYGAVNSKVREVVGMPLIFWNIDTLDWKYRDEQTIVDNVMNVVKDGDIILMHDIHDETIEAAKILIPTLQEAGYQLVTVSELADLRGVTLESGVGYLSFPEEE